MKFSFDFIVGGIVGIVIATAAQTMEGSRAFTLLALLVFLYFMLKTHRESTVTAE